MGLTRVVTDQATYTVHHGLTGSPLKVFQCQTGTGSCLLYSGRTGSSLDWIVDSSDSLFCYFCLWIGLSILQIAYFVTFVQSQLWC